MKHWVLGAAFVGAVALAPLPAAADGLRHREAYKDSYYEPATAWGGLYAGGFAGFAHSWADVDVVSGPAAWDSWSASSTDAILGGLVGYNIQHGSTVYGLEAALGVITGGSGAEFELRGRYGVASDNWLYYGTAGVAFGGEPHFDWGRLDDTAFVIGGGAETRIGRNTNVGLEGLYYYYGDDTYSVGPFTQVEASGGAFALRGRLTYKFNGLR